jgi:DNA replication and repair protein RecF
MDVKLHKLQVTNFRNLNSDIFEFSDNINCIFGDNGNGKTNILEAIYYLINRKSFRKNTSFPQIISIESEKPEILFSSILKEDKNLFPYTGKWALKNTEWYIDNKPTKKKPNLKTVFINPFDSYSFHSIPSFRRDWFDSLFSKLSEPYKKNLKQFTDSLKFRNNLLSKRPAQFREQIKAIDPTLAEHTFNLLKMRYEFIEGIESYCTDIFRTIFHEDHQLKINMDSKFKNLSVSEIANYYNESLQKDEIMYKTHYGIHRDDYVLQFDGFNSYEYCSLGQQKMSFLSLIFAYIELFRYKFNSYPIVLIDDVSGELDSRRWKNLIDYLRDKKFQVMITTANENFKEKLESIEESKKFYIENGYLNQV